jgi:hypothetical protein
MDKEIALRGGSHMQSNQLFDLCKEGEELVKTYECTKIRRLFFGSSKGRLTLTNKRVLYHATGRSFKGRSLVLNEMPIDDVSGIRTYLGASINWLSVIVFLATLYFVLAPIVFDVFPKSFLTRRGFGFLALLPYIVIWIWSKNVIGYGIKLKVTDFLKFISENKYVQRISPILAIRICRYLFIYGVFIYGSLLFSGEQIYLRFMVYLALYFIVFGASEVFSLMIFSKTTKGTGIHLSGVHRFRLFNFQTSESTALDTMAGAPGRDSEIIIQEIGAIISDLGQMGSLAIDKWK